MDDATSEIGHNIRRKRQAAGLSLDALAKASGVSSTMISEVERSVKNPTVKVAYQIARALNCTLTDLLDEAPVRPLAIYRAKHRRTLVDPETGVTRCGLSSELMSKNLEVAWYTIPPHQSTGEMAANRPGLLEHIIVLNGTLTVVLGGTNHVLQAEDSIAYGVQSTEYRNDAAETCVFLLLSDASQVAR